MRIRFDPKKCTGCMACQMACIDQRDIDVSGLQLPLRYVELREMDASALYYSVGCIHCGKCMNACPEQAMVRDEFDFVQVDADKCIGCGSCIEECPLIVMTMSKACKAMKCDGCAGRIREGLLPACVHTCPTGALYME